MEYREFIPKRTPVLTIHKTKSVLLPKSRTQILGLWFTTKANRTSLSPRQDVTGKVKKAVASFGCCVESGTLFEPLF